MILKVIPKVLYASIMLADKKNMITFSILGFSFLSAAIVVVFS